VRKSNEDDWDSLVCMMEYIKHTNNNRLTLEADESMVGSVIFTCTAIFLSKNMIQYFKYVTEANIAIECVLDFKIISAQVSVSCYWRL